MKAEAAATLLPSAFVVHSQWRWTDSWYRWLELLCQASVDIAGDGHGEHGSDALPISSQPPPVPVEPEPVCAVVPSPPNSCLRLHIYQRFIAPTGTLDNPSRRIVCLVCTRHQADNEYVPCKGEPERWPRALPAFMAQPPRYLGKEKLKMM